MPLRQNQREWYFSKLEKLFSGVKEKYVKQYKNAYECHSPKAKELWDLFQHECERLGILFKISDIIKQYKHKYKNEELSFFD